MGSLSLYDHPDVYGRVFPLSEEEVAFFASLIGKGCGTGIVLDAGCGDGELGLRLGRLLCRDSLGLDREAAGLKAGHIPGTRGDLRMLPYRDKSIAAAVSRLFGYGYQLGSLWDGGVAWDESIVELGRVLQGEGVVALEVPLAHRPELQMGLEEKARLGANLHYRFRYLDVLAETPFGSVLDTLIDVQADNLSYEISAPLHVWTPEGARAWLAAGGLELTAFYAAYDPKTETREPPCDCLRAVIHGHKPPG